MIEGPLHLTAAPPRPMCECCRVYLADYWDDFSRPMCVVCLYAIGTEIEFAYGRKKAEHRMHRQRHDDCHWCNP